MKTNKNWYRFAVGCVLVGLLMGCESNPKPATNLTIAPASVFLTAGTVSVVSLSASGGDSNYTWSVTSTNLGAVYGGGLTAAYVSTTNAGVNTVIVTDGNIGTASAVITQQ